MDIYEEIQVSSEFELLTDFVMTCRKKEEEKITKDYPTFNFSNTYAYVGRLVHTHLGTFEFEYEFITFLHICIFSVFEIKINLFISSSSLFIDFKSQINEITLSEQKSLVDKTNDNESDDIFGKPDHSKEILNDCCRLKPNLIALSILSMTLDLIYLLLN